MSFLPNVKYNWYVELIINHGKESEVGSPCTRGLGPAPAGSDNRAYGTMEGLLGLLGSILA